MDARDWDRIGDLLMQIRKKWHNQECTNIDNDARMTWMIYTLDTLITWNAKCAEFDDKGWL